ncbi:MAG: glycosyltransferase family 2 protein [Bacteroidales bacterium]|nr:glycosyltransferase family 2 protein [Bacteroidales bacterium]
MPRLSFIMPAWKSRYLREAIASIVGQTCPDWELVVVDDCSPEPLQAIVAEFPDPRIRYVRNERNIGGNDLVAQWNHCLTFATGEYVVLAGDDDVYRPEFCAECLRLAGKYPEVDVIHASVEPIDAEGRPLGEDLILPEFTNKYAYLNAWVTGRIFTCVGNFAFRLSALHALGGFIPFPCGFCSDAATPIALSQQGVANTDRMLFCFRISDGHLSSDTSRFKEKLEAFSQMSEWLGALDYGDPADPEDKACLAVLEPQYLHRKVVYEYFNLVLNLLPLSELPGHLRCCRLATPKDKAMMVLRWFKRRTWDRIKRS